MQVKKSLNQGAKVYMEAKVYDVDFDSKKVFVRFKDGREVAIVMTN